MVPSEADSIIEEPAAGAADLSLERATITTRATPAEEFPLRRSYL
ncbi:hypothetical protein H1R20_g9052, partial [Candolleomyces eurysporus]